MRLKRPTKFIVDLSFTIDDFEVPPGMYKGYRVPGVEEYYLPSGPVGQSDTFADNKQRDLNVTEAVANGWLIVTS